MKARALWLSSNEDEFVIFCLSIILKYSFIGHNHSARASFTEVAASPNVNPKKSNYRTTYM